MSRHRNGSKTSAVLELKREHPDWKPRQIAEELSGRGIAVKPQNVSSILTSNRSKWLAEVLNGNATISEQIAAVQEQKQRPPFGDAVELILAAQAFVTKCGDSLVARQALDALDLLFQK